MTLRLDSPDIAPLVAPLSPYGRRLVERSGAEALRLAADEVDPEHLVLVALDDEESAAHRACLHAFADPETIRAEALALAAGILVVGSAAALPFSPRAVDALRAARARAASDNASELDGDYLLVAAVAALEGESARALAAAGYAAPPAAVPSAAAGADRASALAESGVRGEGSLFRDTSNEARRVLSSAARLAQREELAAIGPAHVVLAALDADRARAARFGLTAARAHLVLRGLTADESPAPVRELPPSDAYLDYLAALPAGAGSLEMLIAFHATADRGARAIEGGAEVAQLLTRHRVTRAVLERARTAFQDSS